MAQKAKRRRPRARPARSVLGNDPFERGAAARPPPQSTPTAPGPAAARPPPGPVHPAATEPAGAPTAPPPLPSGLDLARELSSVVAGLLPALRERLGAVAGLLRLGAPEGPLDPDGMDPTLLERAAPLLDFLYLTWWRVEAASLAGLPDGPVVLVANHGGSLPWDALVMRLAVRRESAGHRDLRPLLDETALSSPAVRRAALRLGAVPASPETAQRHLAAGTAVAVFPEGSAPRPWPQRYHIGAFGRGGFVKVALRAGAAIVPCAVVGSEEASPLGRPGYLADVMGLPLLAGRGLPIGPLGGLPLPSRWWLRLGEPIDTAAAGPEAAADPARVAQITGEVRSKLQELLDRLLAERRVVYL